MAFRLERGEQVGSGLRRVHLEQLDAAAAHLAAAEDVDLDESIHAARKALKKSRTVLRLLRRHLGVDRYRVANSRLRDAGRTLAGTRDAAVLVKTLDALLETDVLDAAPYAGLRERLTAEHSDAHRAAVSDAGPREAATERIIAGHADAARWDVDGADEEVFRGLRRLYRQGQRRMEGAAGEPTAEAFHEWRKRVKDLGYAVRIVSPAWPETLTVLAAETERLWDLLGDEHDLHLLLGALEQRPAAFASAADRAALEDVARARRRQRTDAALDLGRRIYAESPACFTGRVVRYLAA